MLSWNEIRVRAAAFADQWHDAAYEKGEAQSFYNEFFEVFGIQRRSVATFEKHVDFVDNRYGFVDLLWPGTLVVEQKSAGRDLSEAYRQALGYLHGLPARDHPRYVLVSDFQNFELHDLDERDSVVFPLAELPENVQKFSFMLGLERRTFADQDPANVEAAELVGHLHDAMEQSGYVGHDLERFLVRIVFCLFADDTGIFDTRGQFLDLLEHRTGEDGSDLGPKLIHLFELLNTPVDRRVRTLDEDLARFPLINGELFAGTLRIPSFNSTMRTALLDAARFDWSEISPAVFGALFQSVMAPKERRAQGAHYTTEENILKVIEPLFLDDLRAEFKQLRERSDARRHLRAFKTRLGQLRFLDPACGCGNFLVIAYRELRRLEIDVIREIRTVTGTQEQQFLDAALASQIDVDQFYGIEIDEFAVRIAEAAMWMMDHIMNNALGRELGQVYARLPLQAAPRIVHDDALEIDWRDVLPREDCSFVFGNPPFAGTAYRSERQAVQLRGISALGANGATLDYVAAWFIKAGEYVLSAPSSPPPPPPHRIRCDELDHARGAGWTAVAHSV